ncbi:MAG: hypothetical protein OEV93_02940 [Candidatus Moranbacteria bacterium]|nr:hypothetical protein [Candidatus Moranbacteria bacterium]
MKSKIYLLLGVFALSLTMLVGSVSAQEEEITDESMGVEASDASVVTQSGATMSADYEAAMKTLEENAASSDEVNLILIAEVNIRNAKLVSQDGNKFKISFDLTNDRKVQPQVRYSVMLLEKGSVSGNEYVETVDESTYSETLSLGEFDSIHREIEYVAPDYLSGDYQIYLNSENDRGMQYAVALVDDVKLVASNDSYVSVSDCLVDAGDGKLYSVKQGVDVDRAEKIKVTCSLKNNASSQLSFYSVIETRERSSFGKTVETDKGDKISLNAGEERLVDFEMNKIEKAPQSYSATLTLENENGDIVSNKTNVRYVVRGSSGTIKSARLDKDQYMSGDVAKIFVLVTSSADAFPGARVQNENPDANYLDIVVMSGNQECSAVVTKTIDPMSEVNNFEIPISKDCINPIVKTTLKDKNGNVLDENVFKVETKIEEVAKKATTVTGGIKKIARGMKDNLFWVFVGLFVIVLVGVFAKKKRSGLTKMILLVLFSGALFFSNSNDASAYTFLLPRISEAYCSADVAVNLNKSYYNPAEAITASSGSIHFNCCNNTAASAATYWYVYNKDQVTVINAAQLLTSGSRPIDRTIDLHAEDIDAYTASGSGTRTAPGTPDLYYARFRLNLSRTFERSDGSTVSTSVTAYGWNPFWVKGTPVAHIDTPANGSLAYPEYSIHFTGHADLGVGGTSINGMGWVDTNPGTASWNGTTCNGTDGTWIGNTFDFYKSGFAPGEHRFCLSVRQLNTDGTELWNAAANTAHATVYVGDPPRSVIDEPAEGSIFNTAQNVTFRGHGVLGTTGSSIDYYAWIDTRPGTDSWNGLRCGWTHSRDLNGDGVYNSSDAFGPSATSFNVNTSTMEPGEHHVCLAVRQVNTFGGSVWSGAIEGNSDNVTVFVSGAACGPNAKNYLATDTAWPGTTAADFCTNSNPVTTPPFPDAPGTATWNCNDPASGVTVPCTATREAPVCPLATYSCQETRDVECTADNCEKEYTIEGTCYKNEGICGTNPTSTQECRDNGVACEDSTSGTCGDCPDTTNWIEVNP